MFCERLRRAACRTYLKSGLEGLGASEILQREPRNKKAQMPSPLLQWLREGKMDSEDVPTFNFWSDLSTLMRKLRPARNLSGSKREEERENVSS